MILRKDYLNKIMLFKEQEMIKIITGVRRSGKTTLLKKVKEYLLNEGVSEERIIHINLEETKFDFINDYDTLKQYLIPKIIKNKERTYILIDEIQYIENFQKLINGIRVSYDTDIYVTGSNSKILSGELATLIAGRYISTEILPLSYEEYLEEDNNIYRYQEYEKYGGLPYVKRIEKEQKEEYLKEIINSIIYRDIAAYSDGKHNYLIIKIINFLCSSIGQMVNPTNITNTLNSNGIKVARETIIAYLERIVASYLFYEVKPYDIKGKKHLQTNSKYYICDNGILNSIYGFQDINKGARLENIVFLELKRRGFSVMCGKIKDKEIDFIATKNGNKEYIQVCYELTENTNREIENLLAIKDAYPKTIITEIYHEKNDIDGVKIRQINEWLIKI